MSISEIIELVSLGITIIGLITTIVVEIRKGKLKDYIIDTMEEAENVYEGEENSGIKKLNYVIDKVKERYKIMSLIMDIRAFIEKIIDLSKNINCK